MPALRCLFAYGTLQPSLAPPHIRGFLSRFRFVAAGRVPGCLYDLGDYPGAVFDASADAFVHGSIFELPDDPNVWTALDSYEGVPTLYQRVTYPVECDDGRHVHCWMYAYVQSVSPGQLIPGGRFNPIQTNGDTVGVDPSAG